MCLRGGGGICGHKTKDHVETFAAWHLAAKLSLICLQFLLCNKIPFDSNLHLGHGYHDQSHIMFYLSNIAGKLNLHASQKQWNRKIQEKDKVSIGG